MNITILERSPGVFRLRIEQRVDGVRSFKTETVKGSRRDAEMRRLELMAQPGRAPAAGGNVTLLSFAKEVFKTRRVLGEIAARTEEGYLSALSYLEDTLGGKRLDKITQTDVEKEYVRLLTDGGKKGALSLGSVKHVDSALRFLFRRALRDNLIDRNPLEFIPTPKAPKQKLRAIPADRVAAFLKSADETSLGPLVRFAMMTGARRGEIVALKWQDVDLERGKVTICRSVTESKLKGEVETAPKTVSGNRTVTLSKTLIIELKEAYAHRISDYVFPTQDGKRRRLSSVSTAVRLIMEKHGLKGFSLHDLRHAHATSLLQKKHNVKAVSQRLGHADVMITLRTYAHVMPQDDDALADEIERVANGETDED